MYCYELHLHTKETSRCGKSPARDMVAAYKEKGFAGVFITDHFLNGNSYANDPDTWEEKMDTFLKGYQAAKAAGDEMGLPVYFGLEYTHLGGNGEDYLVLGIRPEHLYKVHDLGGIVIRAHPFRQANYIARVGIERPGLPVDAIEAFNGGNAKEAYNTLAYDYALREGKPITAGSDTHHVDTTATAYVAFEERARDDREVCEWIKQGKAYVVYKQKYERPEQA